MNTCRIRTRVVTVGCVLLLLPPGCKPAVAPFPANVQRVAIFPAGRPA